MLHSSSPNATNERARLRIASLARTLLTAAAFASVVSCKSPSAARDAGVERSLATHRAPAPAPPLLLPPPRVAATTSSTPSSDARVEDPEALTRRFVTPSLLRVRMFSEGGFGTAFACAVPGVACTAKHVVGAALSAEVTDARGRTIEAPVIAMHPQDDVALLDIRALSLPPLPLTHLDNPPEGTVVCRLGHPPSHPTRPFARCDPLAGVLHESTGRTDGTVLPRLVHLGIGLKGDSGAPLFDTSTRLVVGIHVSEANGSARAALPSSAHDLLVGTRKLHPWTRACAQDGPTDLWKRTLLLSCADLVDDARASHFRHLGAAMLALGRRAEAISAFDEAIELDPNGALGWLWRALVFPSSAHARDDAAFAVRLEPSLREDRTLREMLPKAWFEAARTLRDIVAPRGARLVTLIADGACDACPAFCAAAERATATKLWAVEGANHPDAQAFFLELANASDAGAGPVVAIDGKAALGCDALRP